MVPHWYCPGPLELWRAPSFDLGFSQCNVFILDSVLCLSLCQWRLQSAGEVSYKQDSIWALPEFKGDKPSVLFCWSGTETKLLALGLWKGEKKITFHIVQPTLNQVNLSFIAGSYPRQEESWCFCLERIFAVFIKQVSLRFSLGGSYSSPLVLPWILSAGIVERFWKFSLV